MFLYYGGDKYRGADDSAAPQIFSTDFFTDDGTMVRAGHSLPVASRNSNASFDDRLRHKAHLQLTGHGFDVWARYTRGGIRGDAARRGYIHLPIVQLLEGGTGYQQITFLGSYQRQLNDWLNLDTMLSYDITDVQVAGPGNPGTHWREDEFQTRLIATITPHADHHAALGLEFSHEGWGKKSLGDDEPSNNFGLARGENWDTDTLSGFAEHQWTPNKYVVTVVGLRIDKHSYTKWMHSPRASIIGTPTDRDTVKLGYNRSVRRADDAVMRRTKNATGENDVVETIDNLELRYERQQSDHLQLAAVWYYNWHDVVSFNGDPAVLRTDKIGRLQTYGLEFELAYRTKATDITLSHNFTKHVDLKLTRDTATQNLSASPYGYGNDLANWSNHLTKLTARHELTDQWAVSASARIYWGYPGGEDLADYHEEDPVLNGTSNLLPLAEDSDEAFDASVFVNLGVEYKATDRLSFSAHGYNLLGLFDHKFNKRNQFQRTSQYRLEAPAFGMSVRFDLP